ncbi:sensor histidine kinase [Paenibacillus sp. IB182496]|uniref:histidine kinase n=1 Tax=Paenibacillus sabuli TaxID=2772509 RepID=A0A927GSJ7_9BACL|nr:sensor histidine kinase [Paenibacillus sabuli]MBD2845777.1 sensor histidine kinase [Paenibacillus sabuli]
MLRNWYGRLGLATKQFIFLFSVTLVFFLVLAWTNLSEAERLFKEQVTADTELLLARTNQYIDASLDNIENIVLLLASRSELLDASREEEAIGVLNHYASYNNSMARTLYLIRADGKVYANNQVVYEIVGNPHLQRLYDEAEDNYGALNVSEPYDSPISGHTLAYTMPITGRDKQVLGVVVAELDLERLTTRIAPMIYQSFVLLSSEGRVINRLVPGDDLLPYQPRVYPPELETSFAERLSGLKLGVSSLDSGERPLLIVKSNKNRLGWSLIAFIEEARLYRNLETLYSNYRTASTAWIGILLVSAYLISRSFTRPIRRLVDKMDRVHDVQVIPRLSVTRGDEIGRLARSYNAMLERIQQLLVETRRAEARKKEYELKMLRSQIAPHFLYNTLACISSLAKQRKIEEVRETIRSLVGLLSLSFDKHGEYVSLAEELEGIAMYMHIQQVRYGPQYTYTLDVEEALLPLPVLKLSLQPLVENALLHGIVPQGGGCIQIRGRLERGMVRIYVRDDGCGMPRRQAAAMLGTGEEAEAKQRFTGIGLANVHERIRIHYGSAYGLRIGSRPGVGTSIRLQFPVLPAADPGAGSPKLEQN